MALNPIYGGRASQGDLMFHNLAQQAMARPPQQGRVRSAGPDASGRYPGQLGYFPQQPPQPRPNPLLEEVGNRLAGADRQLAISTPQAITEPLSPEPDRMERSGMFAGTTAPPVRSMGYPSPDLNYQWDQPNSPDLSAQADERNLSPAGYGILPTGIGEQDQLSVKPQSEMGWMDALRRARQKFNSFQPKPFAQYY